MYRVLRPSLVMRVNAAVSRSAPVPGGSRCISTHQVNPSSDQTSEFPQLSEASTPSSVDSIGDLATSLAQEPSFSSMGLAHAYPSGWMQAVMEVIHVNGSIPWWATIAVTTLGLRLLMFPIVVKAQRNMIKMNNLMPEMQRLQMASLKAQTREEIVERNQELMALFREKGVHPIKSYTPLMCQGAVFTSMFFGLRGMATHPVESMKLGGMGWFTDLTVADPILLLPFLTCLTLFINIKRGSDGISAESLPPVTKYLILSMPFVSFPVMCSFPAALNVYWFTTNIISIVQATCVNSPAIRSRLGIGQLIQWKEGDLPMNKTMTFKGLKETLESFREESQKGKGPD